MTLPLRVLLALALLAGSLAGQQLELRFLDVGQGDAVLLREGGKTALVDAGGDGEILPRLRALGVDTIDLVVASHNHADHIGGMSAVLTGTVVRYYLDNAVPHTTATYQRTLQAVASSGAQYLWPTARTITLASTRLRVLPPPPGWSEQNDASVGIVIAYGRFRALLSGDSEWAELRYWLEYDSVPRVHVVKVAHHGSWNGTIAEWTEATRPQAAVISVGAQNPYGHPALEVVRQWETVGARVYRTDVDGTIVILADTSGTFTVTSERANAGGLGCAVPSAAESGTALRTAQPPRPHVLQDLFARQGVRQHLHQPQLHVPPAGELRVRCAALGWNR